MVFQKGGFGGCSHGTKTGTRVRSHVPPERKPERGYVRQNHPFTQPPFCLPVSLELVVRLELLLVDDDLDVDVDVDPVVVVDEDELVDVVKVLTVLLDVLVEEVVELDLSKTDKDLELI